jgi:hypothetical protein
MGRGGQNRAIERTVLRRRSHDRVTQHPLNRAKEAWLELGGAVNDSRNLWPEPGGSPNPKDSVENALRHLSVDDPVGGRKRGGCHARPLRGDVNGPPQMVRVAQGRVGWPASSVPAARRPR